MKLPYSKSHHLSIEVKTGWTDSSSNPESEAGKTNFCHLKFLEMPASKHGNFFMQSMHFFTEQCPHPYSSGILCFKPDFQYQKWTESQFLQLQCYSQGCHHAMHSTALTQTRQQGNRLNTKLTSRLLQQASAYQLNVTFQNFHSLKCYEINVNRGHSEEPKSIFHTSYYI